MTTCHPSFSPYSSYSGGHEALLNPIERLKISRYLLKELGRHERSDDV
jgi:hypothetical protein